MDGRLTTVLLTLALPGALIALTIIRFSSNPLAILGLFSVMIGGGLYLLTYSETFSSHAQ
ncbi:MAG: hypothetical protein ACHQ2Y_01165 [Candidatus Lutacidiplasmatales archaeon]